MGLLYASGGRGALAGGLSMMREQKNESENTSLLIQMKISDSVKRNSS
jgi:hypothetical protein